METPAPRRINLGSGKAYQPGWVNLDITPDTNPDVVHDLNEMPWPFDDDRFDHVRMIDVLENLTDPFRAMLEVHRVCSDGARVELVVPHFSSDNAYSDITHRTYWGYRSLDTLTGQHHHDYYTRLRFRMSRRAIEFHKDLTGKVVGRLANAWPERYERRWAWIFPAWFVVFELDVVKS